MTAKNSIKARLNRLEEKRQQRITLKTLYERKAASICGNRDTVMLEKQAEMNSSVARVIFGGKYTDVDAMELELDFKRQSSHGPLNYYMNFGDQLNRYQNI